MKPVAMWIGLASLAVSGCCGSCCKQCSLWSSAKHSGPGSAVNERGQSLTSERSPVNARSVGSPYLDPSGTPSLEQVNHAVPEAPLEKSRLSPNQTGSPSAQMTVPPPPLGAGAALPTLSEVAASAKKSTSAEGWNTAEEVPIVKATDLPSVSDESTRQSPKAERQTIGVTDTLPRTAYAPRAD